MPEIPIHKGLSEVAERYDGFDARLADPLRRDQLRKLTMRIIRIAEVVEVREPIACRSARRFRERGAARN